MNQKSEKIPENLNKTSHWVYEIYGSLNSDISKYGHLKKGLYFELQVQSIKCDDKLSKTYYLSTYLPNFINLDPKWICYE